MARSCTDLAAKTHDGSWPYYTHKEVSLQGTWEEAIMARGKQGGETCELRKVAGVGQGRALDRAAHRQRTWGMAQLQLRGVCVCVYAHLCPMT